MEQKAKFDDEAGKQEGIEDYEEEKGDDEQDEGKDYEELEEYSGYLPNDVTYKTPEKRSRPQKESWNHQSTSRKPRLEDQPEWRGSKTAPTTGRLDHHKSLRKLQEEVQVQHLLMERIARKNSQSPSRVDVFDLKRSVPAEASQEGLSQRLVDSIITNKYSKSAIKSDDPSKHECSICCVDFREGDDIKILQCLHVHHKKCIDEWLLKRSICPDCKFNLRTLQLHQYL